VTVLAGSGLSHIQSGGLDVEIGGTEVGSGEQGTWYHRRWSL